MIRLFLRIWHAIWGHPRKHFAMHARDDGSFHTCCAACGAWGPSRWRVEE
jgi:hypothetical protein